ncbi:MAG: hypothetical protein US30_C0011G0041 [Candidatus Moranbacteria bacterium GW2011_GWF2_36_839]|nr:MAG: hypothetical protein US27_C0011G0003 [Candidatus Moranbacteria bacterium GW2011_GWF1_36_78]KKQ16810.1 MAG: hypothetical protein US30_C0011G0041 [Candidatus Moranbacteria bacterium GW2011_GWF2_36_839]HAT73613.1 hypothetical protein [Candidatus Moranbacteria bacterium]HBY10575.1 hypothetical protein [Candidatus Moranbacteria bacterium]
MAISNLTSIVISTIGKDRIKEIETARGNFNSESKIKNIERELDNKGVSYIPEAIQKIRELFSSYVKDWEYGKIEKEIGYNVK